VRRQSSSVLAPASCSRNTPMICSSLKRLPSLLSHLSVDGLYFRLPEFRGAGHSEHPDRQIAVLIQSGDTLELVGLWRSSRRI
jgi:hypothetical protein